MRTLHYAALVARFILAAVAAIPRLVWKSGKWVTESFFPRPPAEAAMAMGALDEALAAPAAPAKAPEPKLDPATDWGGLARDYALASLIGRDELDLSRLDEAAEAWLRGLDRLQLLRVSKLEPRVTGEHMLGTQAVVGLVRCPSLREYQTLLVQAATPGTAAFEERVAREVLQEEGFAALAAEGRLGHYRGI